MNSDKYYEKYQKYKLKYIDAKNLQLGGGPKVPLDRLAPSVSIPPTTVNATLDKYGYYNEACRPQVPYLCGEETRLPGYCRRTEADCNVQDFGSRGPHPDDNYIYQQPDSKSADVDAFGNQMLIYRPYIDLDNLETLISGKNPDVVKNIKEQVKKIREDVKKSAENRPSPPPAKRGVRVYESGTEPSVPPLAPPLPSRLPPPLPTPTPSLPSRPPPPLPTSTGTEPGRPVGTISEDDLRQKMLAQSDKIDAMIKKYDAELLTLQNGLKKANLTTQKLGSTVNQLVPIVTQIVIAFASLKNMNSSMFQRGF